MPIIAMTHGNSPLAIEAVEQPMPQADPVLSILLPVRNEGINLTIMLKILRVVVEVPHEILVVHDSPDDTSIPIVNAIIPGQPRLRLIHNTLGRGVINAIRAGVKEARGEFVLIFAADEVGPVLALQDMLHLMNDGCEFVSCTRYAHGGRRLGGSLIGGLLSRLANRMFHLLAGSVLSDATTGIKMFRRSIFERFHLEARPVGWAVTFEMGIKAQVLELKLGEVPIISIDRLYGGKSTFHLTSWFREYLRWFIWGAFELRKHPRAKIMVRLPSTSLEVR
jgi:dolichol-phosphate mannosyltransferase